MKYLVAMDSNPVSLPDYLKKCGRTEDAQKFQNGEVTLTLIRTEKGKTIQIEHNVASPRLIAVYINYPEHGDLQINIRWKDMLSKAKTYLKVLPTDKLSLLTNTCPTLLKVG